jgi:hypothetical protein
LLPAGICIIMALSRVRSCPCPQCGVVPDVFKGGIVQPDVINVEHVKTQVRKMAAGRVLAGQAAEVGLDLARVGDCRACIEAGYGQVSKPAQTPPRDRFLWVLDGLVEVYDAGGRVATISQGESLALAGAKPYRLVFPSLTLYLYLESLAADGKR